MHSRTHSRWECVGRILIVMMHTANIRTHSSCDIGTVLFGFNTHEEGSARIMVHRQQVLGNTRRPAACLTALHIKVYVHHARLER